MTGQLFPTQPKLTEKEWQKKLIKRLVKEHWAYQHIYRSKMHDGTWRTTTSAVGWPDLVALRDEWLLIIENKNPDRNLKVGPAQQLWLDRFALLPFSLVWVLDSTRTDWQDLANWLHRPDLAPRIHGWRPSMIVSSAPDPDS
jgi:hypothetical protein